MINRARCSTLALATAFTTAAGTMPVQGALLAYEGWDAYPNGTSLDGLAIEGGIGWTAGDAWTRSGGNNGVYLTDAGTSLEYNDGTTSLLTSSGSVADADGGKRGGFDRNFDAAALNNGGDRWFSLLFRLDAGPTADLADNFAYSGINRSAGSATNSGAIDGFRLKNWSAGAGTYDLIANANGAESATSTSLTLGNTYLIVGHLFDTSPNNQDVVTIYLNPDVGVAAPANFDASLSVNSQISNGDDLLQFAFSSIGNAINSPFEYHIDEIRVGDKLIDVVPAVPEPAGLGLLAASVVLLRRR